MSARRRDDESGQALVLALAIVLVGMLLGLAAVAFALNAGGQAAHDERNRGAQQAADTGVQDQLFLQSDSAAVGYNLNGGGVLGAGALLSCVLPSLNVSLSGSVTGVINSSGQCVPITSAGTPCTSTSCAPSWSPVDNEDYYESEFFANPTPQGQGGSGNTFQIQFPEIVSLGCHTATPPTSANPTAATAACNGASPANSYSRGLATLEPTAPLQAVEAGNDATVWGSSTLLASTLYPLLSNPLVKLVTLGATGVTGALALCGDNTLPSLLNSLGTTLLSSLNLTASGVTNVCGLIESAADIGQIAVVNGNLSAGHDLYLPQTTIGLDSAATGTSGNLGGVAGALETVLTSVTNVLLDLSNIQGTFEYGDDNGSDTGDVCTLAYAGKNPSAGTTNPNCSPQSSSTVPVTSVGANFVQAGAGACVAGKPSSDCTVQRPIFKVTTAPLTAVPSAWSVTGPAASIGSTPGTQGYGILTIPTNTTVTLAAGTYAFCGLYANGTIATPPSGGGVQIYILAPGSQGCSSNSGSGSAPQAGSFVACNGVGNQLLDGLGLDGATSAVNPSGVQIYVQGDSSYTGDIQGTDTAVGTVNSSAGTLTPACPYTSSGTYTKPGGTDPDTQVYVANSSGAAQAFIVYAPASEVTINTSSVFEGSAIGWNVDLSATAIVQDLDIGNYPVSSAVNAYQIAREQTCSSSVVPLTDTPAVFSTNGSGSITTANDLSGC